MAKGHVWRTLPSEDATNSALWNGAVARFESEDYSAAGAGFQALAEQGSVNALVYLGYMYTEGLGVPADRDKAIHSYRRAAEQGSVHGQWALAMLLHLRNEFPEALSWYVKAAEQSHPSATYWVFSMYSRGEGTDRDAQKAQDYLIAALRLGHIGALRARASQLLQGSEGLGGIARGLGMLAKSVVSAAQIAYANPNSPYIR